MLANFLDGLILALIEDDLVLFEQVATSNTVITTLESDLEGPAAEDSGFGPVAEDNYQPAQPESTEEPKGADQPESAEEPKSADQHESAEQAQPQQAAPAAAPRRLYSGEQKG